MDRVPGLTPGWRAQQSTCMLSLPYPLVPPLGIEPRTSPCERDAFPLRHGGERLSCSSRDSNPDHSLIGQAFFSVEIEERIGGTVGFEPDYCPVRDLPAMVDSRGIEPLTSPCHGGVFPVELRAQISGGSPRQLPIGHPACARFEHAARGGDGGSRTPDLPVRTACFPDYTTSPKSWDRPDSHWIRKENRALPSPVETRLDCVQLSPTIRLDPINVSSR